MYFSISYTDSMYVIALSNRQVGIDIEKVNPCKYSKLIIQKYFSKNEQEYINEEDKEDCKFQRFFELWTKREAYVKYIGTGIDNNFKYLDMLNKTLGVMTTSLVYNDYVISYCVPNGIDIKQIIHYKS